MSEQPPTTITVEFRPFNGAIRQLQVDGDQLRGRACIIGKRCCGTRLANVGTAYTDAPPGSPHYSWPAMAHPECLEASR
ncbi:hypothetical protein ACIRRH_00510 [Kitasatospora sp. NPDC101235]|uniref:hypothetical protein n=1 Tax=Kitasatospora sp. NPDC101235 TaxID=3364101 RepID=UPI0037FD9AA7